MKKGYFSEAETRAIVETIRKAEEKTSGEIRLHVENRCWRNTISRARAVFRKLKMHRTQQRNGVLLYLAVKSRKFAIVGDSGIHEKAGTAHWEAVKTNLQSLLAEKQIHRGICRAIEEIGAELARHFPPMPNDDNELENEISTG